MVDQLRNRAYGDRLYEFHGGARASDADKYYNRRSEVWGLGEWLAAGAQIPDDPENGNRPVEGQAEQDLGGCLAMTFSITVRALFALRLSD